METALVQHIEIQTRLNRNTYNQKLVVSAFIPVIGGIFTWFSCESYFRLIPSIIASISGVIVGTTKSVVQSVVPSIYGMFSSRPEEINTAELISIEANKIRDRIILILSSGIHERDVFYYKLGLSLCFVFIMFILVQVVMNTAVIYYYFPYDEESVKKYKNKKV